MSWRSGRRGPRGATFVEMLVAVAVLALLATLLAAAVAFFGRSYGRESARLDARHRLDLALRQIADRVKTANPLVSLNGATGIMNPLVHVPIRVGDQGRSIVFQVFRSEQRVTGPPPTASDFDRAVHSRVQIGLYGTEVRLVVSGELLPPESRILARNVVGLSFEAGPGDGSRLLSVRLSLEGRKGLPVEGRTVVACKVPVVTGS